MVGFGPLDKNYWLRSWNFWSINELSVASE